MATTVSVIIVSQGRPALLTRCLSGLAYQQHVMTEVVVVADAAGFERIEQANLDDHIKLVRFSGDNISEARNRGIAAAAGDIIAFIDDDAVPEPLWLYHLLKGFDDPSVLAATGFVRGRNGISFQWRAETIDRFGDSHPLDVDPDQITTLAAHPNRAIKTPGTNMAFRRDALAELGGFDPRYRFYLDESDLNMRMAALGGRTAIVPMAQVHHAYAASARRSADRTPRSLVEIGASLSVFLAAHAPEASHEEVRGRFVDAQRIRLLRLMQRGPLGPPDVRRLLHGLKEGLRAGQSRAYQPLARISRANLAFRPYCTDQSARNCLLFGRPWQRAALERQAVKAAAEGQVVTVFVFSPTALFHRVSYDARGFWLQSGGLWGKSDRTDPAFQPNSFSARCRREAARVVRERGLEPTEAGR